MIHSFWVPQMGGKVDMIPGRVNHIRFVPLKEGEYLGRVLRVLRRAARQDALSLRRGVAGGVLGLGPPTRRQPAAQPTGAEAVAGGKLIQTIACGGCHTIRGTPRRARSGPTSRISAAAAASPRIRLPNTPQNLLAWLQDPQAIKPECPMPTIPLPLREQQQLVAYLEELK